MNTTASAGVHGHGKYKARAHSQAGTIWIDIDSRDGAVSVGFFMDTLNDLDEFAMSVKNAVEELVRKELANE